MEAAGAGKTEPEYTELEDIRTPQEVGSTPQSLEVSALACSNLHSNRINNLFKCVSV